MSGIHFYLTFNPFLNHEYEQDYTQAHEFYDYLKDIISKDKKGTAYWGKIIGKDRDSSFDIKAFQEAFEGNTDESLSTHLYITDFKNLWVGKIKNITDKMPKGGKTLSFYEGKKVEAWFEISDFILIEHNSEETASKLSELYIENKYNDQIIHGLSPFTTSIKYPCLIQDIAEEQYFDQFDDSEFSHLIFKVNPAITKSNAGQVLKSLHTYVFPEEMYSKLPHAAKLEIESAEVDMLEQRHHNMQKIAFSYLRALEIIMNDLIVHHMKKSGLGEHFFVDATSSPPKLYLNHTKDYFVPLKKFNKNFSIAHLLNFMDRASNQNHMGFKKAFADKKTFVKFITKDFADIVRSNHLIEIRNALAHGESDKLSFKNATVVRNIILGCGVPGLIQMCYKTFYKEQFKGVYTVNLQKESASKPTKKSGLKLVG
jgi:hypothetical protein